MSATEGHRKAKAVGLLHVLGGRQALAVPDIRPVGQAIGTRAAEREHQAAQMGDAAGGEAALHDVDSRGAGEQRFQRRVAPPLRTPVSDGDTARSYDVRFVE